MFAIVAVNFEAFQDLPPPEFKLLVALLRYANRAGGCCPSLSQLAGDIRASAPTVSRYLDKLEARGCFTRERHLLHARRVLHSALARSGYCTAGSSYCSGEGRSFTA